MAIKKIRDLGAYLNIEVILKRVYPLPKLVPSPSELFETQNRWGQISCAIGETQWQ